MGVGLLWTSSVAAPLLPIRESILYVREGRKEEGERRRKRKGRKIKEKKKKKHGKFSKLENVWGEK
jgi:hypothetical protein